MRRTHGPGGGNGNGKAGYDAPDRGEQIQPAHVRKIEIGEDQIPCLIDDALEGDDWIRDMTDVEATALAEHIGGEARGSRVVLDDKDLPPADGLSDVSHTCMLLGVGSLAVRYPVAGRLQQHPASRAASIRGRPAALPWERGCRRRNCWPSGGVQELGGRYR